MFIQPRTSQWIGIAALAMLLVGCRDDRKTRTPEPDQRSGTAESRKLTTSERAYGSEVDPHPEWRITAVVIDVGLAELCGIDAAQTHFDYDSAELDPNAQTTVTALADCFVEGPLAERNLVVTGHADPRGPDDYNRELGMSRAEAVAEVLRSEGIAVTRIDVESHGEAEAHADPAEWPDDRRVDIDLAE
jgi:outer membrane protein OmpA-like peptidoglycan-associated protein